MTQIVIADDEPLLRFHLQKVLAEVWPDAEVVAQAANGEEALALIMELSPDVAFLDIRMPGLTGLEVALKVVQLKPETRLVFLTAYDEYAVEAFDRGAIDYLLKPVDEDRLLKTVNRLQGLLTSQANQTKNPDVELLLNLVNGSQKQSFAMWLNVQDGESVKVISIDDVLFLKAEDKYTTLVTAQREYLLRQSIKQLEDQLDPQRFWRIHRSTLVNMEYVDRIEKTLTGQYQLYLKGIAYALSVSRAKQHLFKAL